MNSKIPIIALTADVTTVDLAKCKSVGMDDYLSKPVDDHLLYKKIAELVRKPTILNIADNLKSKIPLHDKLKIVDLSYLTQRTKSDPNLMMKMIAVYLEQTPPLIDAMKKCLKNKDWNALQVAVHKMIPSFSIMGISKDFENMAKKVQEHTNDIQFQMGSIPNLVNQLEAICSKSCNELEEEFKNIKKKFLINNAASRKN